MRLLLISVILIVFSFATSNAFAQSNPWDMVAPNSSKEGVTVGQSFYYVGNIGTVHVVGEIINNQPHAIEYVKVIAVLRDARGNLLDTSFTYTMMDVIPPHGKSPFNAIFFRDDRNVDGYTIQLEWSETEDLPMMLDVKRPVMSTSSIGTVHIKGEVKNTGTSTANYVKVIGNIYDADGELIGTSFTFTSISDIGPKQSSSYDLIFLEKFGTPASFQVYAQSQEYGTIIKKPVEKAPLPNTTETIQQKIPEWVRNVFVWYAEGQISEDELLNAIKFLVQSRIIIV